MISGCGLQVTGCRRSLSEVEVLQVTSCRRSLSEVEVLQVTSCRLRVASYIELWKFIIFTIKPRTCNLQPPNLEPIMSSYRDIEIYRIAFELAKRIHYASLKLPGFELYEQGSQIRRSSKSTKDQIVEGYGRKRYKADFIKFLVYSHSSCDETQSQLEMLKELYPEITEFSQLSPEYENLGRKIHSFIEYVENNWKT